LVPVNGGCSLKSDEWCRNNVFFDDDCVGSLSGHNKALNEMTSIWWARQSMEKIGNPDYVGFNHYRRFFDMDAVRRISDGAIYIAKQIRCPYPLEWQYGYYHVSQDLATCTAVLSELCRNGDSFARYMRTHTDNFAPMNMFVMRRDFFEEWCDFAFPVLLELERRIDVSDRDNYQKRAVCFLCERMFGWWCWEKSQVVDVRELDVVERLEFKDNSLNERGTYGDAGR